MLPTDPRAIQLYHNIPALVFYDYWQQRNREDDFKRLGEILGVYWDADTVESLFAPNTFPEEAPSVPDRCMFPLAFVLKPEFRDTVKNVFGSRYGIDSPGWARQKENIVELGKVSKEEFKKFYSSFISPRAPHID